MRRAERVRRGPPGEKFENLVVGVAGREGARACISVSASHLRGVHAFEAQRPKPWEETNWVVGASAGA